MCRLVSAAINSLGSFYWDVVSDWDLGWVSSRYPLLRDQLIFRSPIPYYVTVMLDLTLRLSWSLRLSSRLYIRAAWGTFFLESLEIPRRMMWIFLRLEHKHLKLKLLS